MNFGDTPIANYEHQFTLAEACNISGVSENDLRNWKKRDVVDVGERHRTGRWLFSIVDTVLLAGMSGLMTLTKMDPSEAVQIAQHVVIRMEQMFQRGPDGRMISENPDGSRRETRIIVSYDKKTNTRNLTFAQWDGSSYSLQLPRRGEEKEWLRHPVIIIPADQIIFDTLEAAYKILEAEHTDE